MVHGFVKETMFSYSGTRPFKPTVETKIGSTSGGTVFTDLGDMVGKPEAVSLESEIVSKKGKIPSREVNETHLKVTRPKSSKVTEKPKAERKQKKAGKTRSIQ